MLFRDDIGVDGVHFERSKKIYFLIMALVAAIGSLVFAGVSFRRGEVYWVPLSIYGVTSLGLLYYMLRFPAALQSVINIHVGLLFLAQCGTYLYMLDYQELYIWFVVFPMIYFFLLGHRWGLVLAIALGVFYVVGYFIHPLIHHPPQVGVDMLINAAIAYVVITFLTSVYARFVTIRHEETSLRADIDYLTGIYNRSAFQTHLDSEISRIQRLENKQHLSVLLFDIDNFKLINDKHGHTVGDEILKELCKLISANLRKHDTFARWGGEEFVIIAPNTDISGACRIAEKLRHEIAEHHFNRVGEITSSFGVTEYSDGELVRDLIHRADGALYRAKGSGKNRVESA